MTLIEFGMHACFFLSGKEVNFRGVISQSLVLRPSSRECPKVQTFQFFLSRQRINKNKSIIKIT